VLEGGEVRANAPIPATMKSRREMSVDMLPFSSLAACLSNARIVSP